MKKNIVFIYITLAMLVFSSSCKKGEHDPGFTLKTRKARVTAEWKLTTGQLIEEIIDGSSFSSEVIAFDGENMHKSSKSFPYSETMNIERDGTFSKTIISEVTYFVSAISDYKTAKVKRTETGVWYFVGGSKAQEFEKKERVAFETLTVKEESDDTSYVPQNETYTGTQDATIMVLDRLARTEIIVTIDNSNETDGVGENKFRQTLKGTLTYEKQ